MPAFSTADIKSPDAAAIVHTADMIAELASWQEICEATGVDAAALKADATTHIVYGIHAAAWDGRAFTTQELEARLAECFLHPRTDASESTAIRDDASDPLNSGQFDIEVRRTCRQSEISSTALRSNLFLWFYDRCHWLKRQMISASQDRECPRLHAVQMDVEPTFLSFEEESVGAEVLYCRIVATWGDVEE